MSDLAGKVAGYTDKQIQALIDNHRRLGATDKPTYHSALGEQARRRGGGLSFEQSVPIILAAAREGRFLSYKDLADASGADWNKVHYAIGNHLWRLIEFGYRMGWPILSAVVVNKVNVESGRMEPDTLKGFISAAEELGYLVGDELAFLQEEQEKVFAWARTVDMAEIEELINADR